MSLLELLDESGIRSTAQLAAELGTTPEMVKAKLERYTQLGYARKTAPNVGCGGACARCRGCDGLKGDAAGPTYWERIR